MGDLDDWNFATLTVYESYPTTTKEKRDFSGSKYVGMFSGLEEKIMSEEWVRNNNIAAIHSHDFHNIYRLQKEIYGKIVKFQDIIIKGRNKDPMRVTIYDECDDNDCFNKCSDNKKWNQNGFLIDLEKYTAQRFFKNYNIDIDKIRETIQYKFVN